MTKLSKILKYLAVSAFLLALVVNVKVSLSDPFITMSEEAIAQTTSYITTNISGVTITCNNGGSGQCYKLIAEMCPYPSTDAHFYCTFTGYQTDHCSALWVTICNIF